jgi:hypothetical protein
VSGGSWPNRVSHDAPGSERSSRSRPSAIGHANPPWNLKCLRAVGSLRPRRRCQSTESQVRRIRSTTFRRARLVLTISTQRPVAGIGSALPLLAGVQPTRITWRSGLILCTTTAPSRVSMLFVETGPVHPTIESRRQSIFHPELTRCHVLWHRLNNERHLVISTNSRRALIGADAYSAIG